VLLSDDLVEILGAILAGKNLVAHGSGYLNLPMPETRNGILRKATPRVYPAGVEPTTPCGWLGIRANSFSFRASEQ